MGPRTLVGDMVDNHVKEKGLPPIKDEFLDVLSLDDIMLEGLFRESPTIEEDDLVVPVNGVNNKSQQLTTSPTLITRLSLPAQ